METKLRRISELVKDNPEIKLTSLYHLLNYEMLIECHKELKGNKAIGIDNVSKQEYEENIDKNINNFVDRLKKHSYKPKPVKRIYILKDNGDKRPLGIASYEEKIVQLGLAKILNAVYEPIFMETSYGFRPKRSCHDAIRKLHKVMIYNKVNYVVDADIKGFFNNVDHDWMLKFVGEKIADPNIKRLIIKSLKAGIMDNGKYEESDIGTVQGGLCLARHNPPYVEINVMRSLYVLSHKACTT
jgi:group II intron reverse transcriptase/maturase